MTVLYGISCVAAFLIVVAYIGFFNKKDNWFLMSFISLLFCNTGYFTLALSRTLEEALLANRIAYLGSVFMPFFLLMTIMKVCKCRYPEWLPFVLSFINAAMLLVTVSTGYTELYYSNVAFEVVDGAGRLIKEYGVLHPAYYVYLLCYFGAMLGVIIRSFFKGKIVSYKHALCLAVAVFVNIAIYFYEKLAQLEFEALSFSYIVSALFLLFLYKAIEDYNIESIMQSTLATDSTGVILFDSAGAFKGCNDDAALIFPELTELRLEYPVPEQATTLRATVMPVLSGAEGAKNMTYAHAERIYRVVGKDIRHKGSAAGKLLGTAVIVSDDTAQQEYLRLISSYNEKLEAEVARKTQHLMKMHDNLILSMADMVEGRDPNTGGHIKRTSSVVAIFVRRLRAGGERGYSESFLSKVAKAAPMHDLGKIAIDDAILRKPGKYTPEEYAIMQRHAEKGADIVGRVLKSEDDEEFYSIAVNVAHYHHEKFDGSGYPEGLRGEDIPLEARIMALADVFDALVSRRCYKEKYSYEQAFSIIRASLGQHFDPELGEVFLACADELRQCYDGFDKA